jgi:hypothetical protein
MALLTANKYRRTYHINKCTTDKPFKIFLYVALTMTLSQTVLAILDSVEAYLPTGSQARTIVHALVVVLPILTTLVMGIQDMRSDRSLTMGFERAEASVAREIFAYRTQVRDPLEIR